MTTELYKKISEDAVLAITKKLESDKVKSLVEKTKAASDEDSGTFEMLITTENIDRMGEVISMDGWEIDNYMRNPVVLWGHEADDLPVGITVSLEKQANGLLARGKFAPESANPFAQQVRKLYDLGVVRASSVGFIIKEQQGNLITKAELLEWSFVSVPANPMCLSTLVKSNLSINEYVAKGLITIKEEEPKKDDEKKDEATDVVVNEAEKTITIKSGEKSLAVFKFVDGTIEKFAKHFQGEKFVSGREMKEFVSEFKELCVALEGVVEKSYDPERNDELANKSDIDAFKSFKQKRKIVQEAATILGDVLAEARIVGGAQK